MNDDTWKYFTESFKLKCSFFMAYHHETMASSESTPADGYWSVGGISVVCQQQMLSVAVALP